MGNKVSNMGDIIIIENDFCMHNTFSSYLRYCKCLVKSSLKPSFTDSL